MQARVHGLATPISPGQSSDFSYLQQQQLPQSLQPSVGESQAQPQLTMDGAMAQTSPSPFLTVPPLGSPAGAVVSGPLDLGTFSFAELDEPSVSDLYTDVGLDDILMDEGGTLPTIRPSDSLFSPMSSGASKTSSRRSSINMEEDL